MAKPRDIGRRRPLLMGVLNVTPDSFSDGGLYYRTDKACERAREMIRQGADIVDVGGESSRPGAQMVPEAEELERVMPVLRQLCGEGLNALFSIDTRKAAVAEKALACGTDMVNDISGLRFDTQMIDVLCAHQPYYLLMHASADPQVMQKQALKAGEVMTVLHDFFAHTCDVLQARGFAMDKLLLDPGIGFGKTVDANLTILRNLSELKRFGKPLVIGTSRKSFIGALCDCPENQRLPGSIASALYAYAQGADIIRCHDVAETRQALSVYRAVAEGVGR